MNQKNVLLGVLGIGLVAVAQNLTPSMSVVFLGGKLPSLPLGIWLFIAFTLGLISSRLITIILQSADGVSEYTDEPETDSTRKTNIASNPVTDGSRSDRSRSDQSGSSPQERNRSPGKNFFSKSKRSVNSEDDWEQTPKPPKEWEEERPNPVTWGNGEQDSQNTYRSVSKPPERPIEKPKDTVYDADYRVIIPPYGASAPPPTPPSAPKKEKDTTDWDTQDSNPSEDQDWV
ncbi:hypothetical protein [Roseofilum sp. Guam]|uniref:hypothetical protein n=1 Tax=Roseofilum sp. Guam TaxID=2821502 RepID=UPI001B2C6151|nr:hypothetical protein [Roseofilum sp. Guam]MBP0028666.1 hypothetical protein [Roseofilum sp. Guam]